MQRGSALEKLSLAYLRGSMAAHFTAQARRGRRRTQTTERKNSPRRRGAENKENPREEQESRKTKAAPVTEPRASASGLLQAAWRPLANARGSVPGAAR